MSKIHLTDSYLKEISNNDSVVNVKNFEISDELGQNLSDWKIYLSTESSKESAKGISRFQWCKRSKCSFRPHKLWRKCLFLQLCHTGLLLFTIIERLCEQTRTTCQRSSYENEETFQGNRNIKSASEDIRLCEVFQVYKAMNLACNMMLMSACCSYLQKFTQVLMMTACLRLIN